MTIDNDLINEILKIAYKAVPKKCALDGTKLIEAHDEMREFLKIKLLNKADVISLFYCHDECVRNAAEDYSVPKCKEQCQKCKQ